MSGMKLDPRPDLMEIRTIRIYKLLSTVKKSIYYGSVAFLSPGTDELFEGFFLAAVWLLKILSC